jgi:Secretion system C-terminal sorting domain
MKQKYVLFALLSLFFSSVNAQSNYAVTSIPFQPFSGSLAALSTSDDLYSGVINLPFNFDYYGVSYNQIVISTNGYIDFRTTNANLNSPWSFNQTIPNAGFPVKNSILGCYEDLYNNGNVGSLTYGSYGTAPYRKFVVYFNNQPHFSCTTATSSFQMILSETSNIIDVQILDRQICSTWNGGNAVIGLVNSDGTAAIAAPGRNTGNWIASQEAWRFYRPNYYTNYSYVRCDDDTDGVQVFDLSVVENDLSGNFIYYATLNDVQMNNPILNSTSFTNATNPQTIYALGGGMLRPIVLNVIDCTVDADADGVATSDEDANNDTNLANDDTDFDGLPNYMDNDDDGDLILTSVEYVFNKNVATLLDTDNDGIPNYLDNDDDGDQVLTFMEDYNHDGNPANDDTNTNGIADFLETAVALGVKPVTIVDSAIQVYPNPTSDVITIQNTSTSTISTIEIYSINGAQVRSIHPTEASTTVSVTDLQSGVYFVKVVMDNQVGNYKFIKN